MHFLRSFTLVQGAHLGFAFVCALASLLQCGLAFANGLEGLRSITLDTSTGRQINIGNVTFERLQSGAYSFKVTLNHAAFSDHFLSMKEFKCVGAGPELMCHVPYPYESGTTVTESDFAWLEHSLLFMFKRPSDFGAKLWNGVYFQLERTPNGLTGKPQAVDLNQISAPPGNTEVPPFKRKSLRDDYAPNSRWVTKVRIE